MATAISCGAVKALLDGTIPFALIDVRETGEHNSTHIPDSSLIPRRQLEFQMSAAVPVKDVQVVLYDDDGSRAKLAVATLEKMGYSKVSYLDGGINE